MKSLESIAADLAEYIDARQRFLTAASKLPDPQGGPVNRMGFHQHVEVARLLFNSDRLVRNLDIDKLDKNRDGTADLVGVLEAVYTALAHLGAAYDVHWVVPESSHARGTEDSGVADDGQPTGDAGRPDQVSDTGE